MKIIHIKNSKDCANKVINQCLEYLVEKGGVDISLGRHDIENSGIYVNVSEYTTRQREDSIWEAHKQYADLHLLLIGEEQILMSNIESMDTGIYHADTDYLECNGEYEEAIMINNTTCLLLLPEDVHMPGICIDEKPMPVKKAVVKIPMYYFE